MAPLRSGFGWAASDPEHVRRGWRRQPAVGKPEPADADELEAGSSDGDQRVAAGVAAANKDGPDDVGEALGPGQAGGVCLDVLEEAKLATGA